MMLPYLFAACHLVLIDMPNIPFGGQVESNVLLNGNWEGIWLFSGGTSCKIRLHDGKWGFYYQGELIGTEREWTVIDEGNGNLKWDRGGHGIYQWKGKELHICWGVNGRARPIDFSPTNGRNVLIIHQIK
jgi:hypothetical protein